MALTVGSLTKAVKVTLTRTADTTTYAAGDVISTATTGTSPLTFKACAKNSRGGGLLQQLTIVSSQAAATKLAADLFLFDVAPAAANYGDDNEAFAPTDAQMTACVGHITIAATDWVAGGANAIVQKRGLAMPFKCSNSGGGGTDLYGVLVARNAYVPISAEVFTITLHILQDVKSGA